MKWNPLLNFNTHLKRKQFVKLSGDFCVESYKHGYAPTNPLYAAKFGNMYEITKVKNFVKSGTIGIVDTDYDFSNGAYVIRFFDFIEDRMLRIDSEYVMDQIKYR